MAILTIIFLHLVALVKLKFTAWPEMLLWPYLMINDWLPYKDIAIAHTPNLVFALKTFFDLFGVGIIQLKVFSWILIIISDLVFYFLLKRTWAKEKKDIRNQKLLFALSAFVLWQVYFDGNGLWFELALLPLSIVLYYLSAKKNYFWAGVIAAASFFTKQTAIWFLVPLLYGIIVEKSDRKKNFGKLLFGSSVAVSIYCVVMYFLGILPDFFSWAIGFGVFVLPRAQGQIQLPSLKVLVVALFPFIVFAPQIFNRNKKTYNLLLWAIAGGFAAYPRFEYFHFQTAVPFLAIATAEFISQKTKKVYENYFLTAYLSVAVLLFSGFFIRNISEGVRFYDADVRELQSFIQKNTTKGEKIFVMNYWDILYPLTNTLPATKPWVPQLAWYLKSPGIERILIDDIRSSVPKLIILNPYTETGLASHIPKDLYEYVRQNYRFKEKVAGMDILVPR